jgi:hypothetical protein
MDTEGYGLTRSICYSTLRVNELYQRGPEGTERLRDDPHRRYAPHYRSYRDIWLPDSGLNAPAGKEDPESICPYMSGPCARLGVMTQQKIVHVNLMIPPMDALSASRGT